ncbi:MAG: hypothetical protein ACOYNS_10480 [Bacteroidota bacterium]
MESKYIIGNLSVLQAIFPDHNFSHARLSLDGTQCVIESDLVDDLNSLEAIAPGEVSQDDLLELEILTHGQALAFLNAPDQEGVWYEPIAEIPPPVSETVPNLELPDETDGGGEQP